MSRRLGCLEVSNLGNSRRGCGVGGRGPGRDVEREGGRKGEREKRGRKKVEEKEGGIEWGRRKEERETRKRV